MGLTIRDILPEDPSKYDKMRPPKKDGNPTIVYFHVTVMGLDSIDENSMVSTKILFSQFFSFWGLTNNFPNELKSLKIF